MKMFQNLLWWQLHISFHLLKTFPLYTLFLNFFWFGISSCSVKGFGWHTKRWGLCGKTSSFGAFRVLWGKACLLASQDENRTNDGRPAWDWKGVTASHDHERANHLRTLKLMWLGKLCVPAGAGKIRSTPSRERPRDCRTQRRLRA